MEYNLKFDIGDIVFLKTDVEQKQRIVTGILIRHTGVCYYLTESINETAHYEFEINKDRDIILLTT